MDVIRTVEWMKQVAREHRAQGRITGFVPTMGALHEGHFSLVRAAKNQCASVVASIFVNPAQFGPSEDYRRYPRPFEQDCAALEQLGVDYLFAPSPEEIYPKDFRTTVIVEGLGERLEGRSRPGHFRGVATVVLKLFEIVQPSFAYFGRKDAQQARIIRQMVADLNLDTELVIGPIVREADGLALSSRNAYLKGEERRAATALYRGLAAAGLAAEKGESDCARLLAIFRGVADSEAGVALDYAEIVNAETFEPVTRLRGSCLFLVAAFVGTTRLIDNARMDEREGSVSVLI